MESEENLSLEKQNSENNVSVGNSSPAELAATSPVDKQKQLSS